MSAESGFQELDLALSRSKLDRAAHLRLDQSALDEMWDRAEIAQISGDRFRILSSNDGKRVSLEFRSADQIKDQVGERYFLGILESDKPYFLWHTEFNQNAKPTSGTFKSLREIGALLNDLEIGIAAHGLALSQWHDTHPMCAKCGAKTESVQGGSVRECVVDRKQHHPRTDPAIIVLVKDSQDRVLLGHQKIWPTNRFSTLAGFVEPGESFERCVRREVFEEAGVNVVSMNYLGSQPWPFPASIMIAYEALIDNPQAAKGDGQEIEEVRWFSRAEMKAAVAADAIILPPTISVARAMINRWYGPDAAKDLIGGEAWRN
jgi:NAD+ diphosphatase